MIHPPGVDPLQLLGNIAQLFLYRSFFPCKASMPDCVDLRKGLLRCVGNIVLEHLIGGRDGDVEGLRRPVEGQVASAFYDDLQDPVLS